MAPAGRADTKAAADTAAWVFNVVTSVGIIMVNKALMATHGFSFGKTLALNLFISLTGFISAIGLHLEANTNLIF